MNNHTKITIKKPGSGGGGGHDSKKVNLSELYIELKRDESFEVSKKRSVER